MKSTTMVRYLACLSMGFSTVYAGYAGACSPPPPLPEPGLVLGQDGKYHPQYDPQTYAIFGEVIGVALNKSLLDENNKPTQGIRVRVIESMTPKAKAGEEVEIFAYSAGDASCRGSHGFNYQLALGTRLRFQARSLIMGAWDLPLIRLER